MNKRSDTPISDDERLADFTDRLLAGETPQKVELRTTDPEMTGLTETIQRIRNAFPSGDPDPAVQNRIRARLLVEFRKNIPGIANTPGRLRIPRRTLQWGLAIGTAIILIGILVFMPSGALTIPGTAGMNTNTLWIPIGIIFLIIAGLIFWRFRKK